MVTTTETIVREDPYTEAYKSGLFESIFDLVNQQMGYERVDTGRTDEDGNPLYENRALTDPETGLPLGPAYAPTYQVAGERRINSKRGIYFRKTLAALCRIYKVDWAVFSAEAACTSKRLS
jgi:hypothetical protein